MFEPKIFWREVFLAFRSSLVAISVSNDASFIHSRIGSSHAAGVSFKTGYLLLDRPLFRYERLRGGQGSPHGQYLGLHRGRSVGRGCGKCPDLLRNSWTNAAVFAWMGPSRPRRHSRQLVRHSFGHGEL